MEEHFRAPLASSAEAIVLCSACLEGGISFDNFAVVWKNQDCSGVLKSNRSFRHVNMLHCLDTLQT